MGRHLKHLEFCWQNTILSDRIQFCLTEYNSVRQNCILSDRIVFCPTQYNSVTQNTTLLDRSVFSTTELYSVDTIQFCWQNCILFGIQFCWQNCILSTEYISVVVSSTDYRWRYFLDIDWLEAIRCGVNIRNPWDWVTFNNAQARKFRLLTRTK